MIKTPISLQELRKRIYTKAKADKAWRFWGLYVHVCKEETLREAYRLVRANRGAPGIDGVTFDAIEAGGLDAFFQQLRGELISGAYRPMRNRRKAIPKGDGRFRILGIPTIRDRVVQGALKLILEPIFEPDFQDGSYGYRPRRTAHQAVARVSQAVVECKTQVIDLDLKAYFDTVRHDLLLQKVAQRVQDPKVLHLLKLILQASGKRGVPQGGVISPLLSNLYLNEVDKMLERAKAVTRRGKYTYVEYARYADDLVILIDEKPWRRWLVKAVYQRLLEELGKLDVQVNTDKTRVVDLNQKESFGFLGFTFRRAKTLRGRWGVRFAPKMKARTALLQRLKEIFRRFDSQPVERVIELINPILRGWVNYFRVGHSSRCFGYVRQWVEKKTRRHLMRARQRPGFGWKRWSSDWLYRSLGLFTDYQVRYLPSPKAAPAGGAT
jgi:RNA-directed DNA polymerase